MDYRGTLYVVSTPIGNLKEMTPRALEILGSVDFIACEDTRVTKKLCSYFNIQVPLISSHEHNEFVNCYKIIDLILSGKKVALTTDAGYPGISDPGSLLIHKAIECDIKIEVISGPCAIINALVGSGLNTDHFYFHGFLPSKKGDRTKELTQLASKEETLIFYESPHRILETLQDMAEVFGMDRRACIARELTKLYEEYIRGNLEELVKRAESEIKGEMVLIIEGNKKKEQPVVSSSDLLKEIDLKINEGMSAKDAIKAVADLYHLSKNEVYRLYQKN